MEGGLAHAELRSDSAIHGKSTEGFSMATYAAVEPRSCRIAAMTVREGRKGGGAQA